MGLRYRVRLLEARLHRLERELKEHRCEHENRVYSSLPFSSGSWREKCEDCGKDLAIFPDKKSAMAAKVAYLRGKADETERRNG
jgi:hypothetical protein